MSYSDYIIEKAKQVLAIDSPSGYTKEAAKFVVEELKSMGYSPEMTVKGGIIADLGGNDSENAILLESHIDTLGAMVTEVKSSGRLKVSPVGGMNANNAEGENCRIITKFNGIYEGTFQLENASIHVNKKYDETTRNYSCMEVVIDEIVNSKSDVKKLGIMPGDYVCFDPRTTVTKSGYIKIGRASCRERV